MASFTVTKTGGVAYATISNAENVNIQNVGLLKSGNATVSLGQTAEGADHSVFNIMQTDATQSMNMDMYSNDSNIAFAGYNMNVEFNHNNNNYGYNVELNTMNSTFDFSGTRSGAIVTTTQGSANNRVQLGGGSNAVYTETVDGALTADGQARTMSFNNLVVDSGSSNVFLGGTGTAAKVETTKTSKGAYVQGGSGPSLYEINGMYGIFNAVNGVDNIFATAKANGIHDTSAFNVMIGGVGTNVVNDFGMSNMYQGAYALYEAAGYSGVNGNDTIKLNGYYGIARVDTSGGADCDFFFNGWGNTGFTGTGGVITFDKDSDGTPETYNYNYEDILQGKVGDFTPTDSTGWSVANFFSSPNAPKGYAEVYGKSILSQFMS